MNLRPGAVRKTKIKAKTREPEVKRWTAVVEFQIKEMQRETERTLKI